MCLKILLPFRVFLEREGVSRIVAETPSGSFGILPRRLDCTATVVPGIFLYESRDEGERFVAIDDPTSDNQTNANRDNSSVHGFGRANR